MDGNLDATPVLDAETRATERPADHKDELRLWLRLLTCTTMIEGEIRTRLREKFDVTLPKFDLMAQLDKTTDGLTLGELSRRMMVSNGNVTGLVERLVELGLVERVPHPTDRRAAFVRLTQTGRANFNEMAAEHAEWIAAFASGMSPQEIAIMLRLLAKMKSSVRTSIEEHRGAPQ
jgi:DNA-binding MarR family transcriptional regulator